MYLVLDTPKRKRRVPFGPIVIVDGRACLNLVNGQASCRQPPPPPRGTFPKTVACDVCGTPFMGMSGNSAYCSKDCQRERLAERRVAEELRAMRGAKAAKERR